MATETIDENARSSFAQITVYVDNENDNDPDFEQDSYSTTILENTVNGTFVTTVS